MATLAIFALILRRVPLAALSSALQEADYGLFLALMIPNTLFYFAWDTLVLTIVIHWFHGPVPYRDLLPVRAASYVVGFFNTNLGRGALAAYLCRRLRAPFLELGSTADDGDIRVGVEPCGTDLDAHIAGIGGAGTPLEL